MRERARGERGDRISDAGLGACFSFNYPALTLAPWRALSLPCGCSLLLHPIKPPPPSRGAGRRRFSPGVKALLAKILIADPARRLSLSQVKDDPWYLEGGGVVSGALDDAGVSGGGAALEGEQRRKCCIKCSIKWQRLNAAANCSGKMAAAKWQRQKAAAKARPAHNTYPRFALF